MQMKLGTLFGGNSQLDKLVVAPNVDKSSSVFQERVVTMITSLKDL